MSVLEAIPPLEFVQARRHSVTVTRLTDMRNPAPHGVTGNYM